jgi:hypothetical protein
VSLPVPIPANAGRRLPCPSTTPHCHLLTGGALSLHPRCSSSQSSFLAWSVTEASLASTFAPRASVSLHNLKRCRLSQLSSSAQRRNMSPAPSVQRQPLRAWEASFISGHLFVLSRGASPWHSTHLKTCLSTSSGTCCTQRGVLEQADLTKLRWQPGKARGSSAAIYLAASNPKPMTAGRWPRPFACSPSPGSETATRKAPCCGHSHRWSDNPGV